MGNADSQASIPGPRGTSFMLPRKPKPYSLRFRPAKQKVLSPHSWWRGREGGSGYKSRALGRSSVFQQKNGQNYSLRQYECFTLGSNDNGKLPAETFHSHPYCELGEQNSYIRECSSHPLVRNGMPGVASPWELVQESCSPRVLVREDGSLQVDFPSTGGSAPDRSARPVHLLKFSPYRTAPDHVMTSTDPTLRTSKGSSLSSDGSWYDSPWGMVGELSDAEKSCSSGQTYDNVNRVSTNSFNLTEEKSTLVSANSSDLTEENPTRIYTNSYNRSGENHIVDNMKLITPIEQDCTGNNNNYGSVKENFKRVHANSSSLPEENCIRNNTSCSVTQDCCLRDSTSSSGHSEDYNIKDSVALQGSRRALDQGSSPVFFADLYRDRRMAVTFPTARDFTPSFLDVSSTDRHASCASIMDEAAEEKCSGVKEYTSYTLPCRKAVPVTDSNARKSSLKSRLRRISDWTGSLSRKKRKLQEPRSNDNEGLDSGVDMQTVEGGSTSQTSNPAWHPDIPQVPSLPYSVTMPALSGSADNDCAAFRQNVYETFMRELETVHGSAEPELFEETAETSSDSGGSLEQLDMLLEKEQGVVRKAGFLSFKPLITLNKDHKLELVARRKWKRYWVTLKGCMLLFYETHGKSPPEQDPPPRYALFAEESIVQAVPEHPKKENVFCLSNVYGDVYLFQAASQTDLENWATAVHSASASLLAKRHGKEDTVRLLCSQTRSLLQKIDMDSKLKKMADLQLSVVCDYKNRRAIGSQIQQWEQNLEKFNMDLFRMRCYLASLQGDELPNPKILLAAASRPSKMALSRLGIFSVSSFHALVCSRDEATLRRRSCSVSQGVPSRRGLFSSLKGLDTLAKRGRDKRQSVSQILESNTGGHLGHFPPSSFEKVDGLANLYSVAPPEGSQWNSSGERQTCVHFADGQAINVSLKPDHTVADVLSLTCRLKQLDPQKHCLRVWVRMGQDTQLSTPAPTDVVQDLLCDKLEVFPLNIFILSMTRPISTMDFGFAVTGHVDGSGNSHMFVSEVLQHGLAFTEGLRSGDEILVLNGTSVSTLDLGQMQTLFGQQKLNLVIKREDTVTQEQAPTWPDSHPMEPCSSVLPLSQSRTLGKSQQEQHCMQPFADVSSVPDIPCSSIGHEFEEEPLQSNPVDAAHTVKSMETVTTPFSEVQENTRVMMEYPGDSQPSLLHPPCLRHMSDTERLRKVVQELVDTEKSYVKDLSCLFEIYLKPLQSQTFLSLEEMESLFGSLPEMLDFQRVFLQTLEEHIASSPDFNTLETPGQFQKLLFSLGGSFLYYADHFKLYSGFCANHIKVQKVLERAKTDWAFKDFLEARNPTKQHSSTLESYLIKPVQRVLKYPLLLRELVSLTDADSEEHSHLTEGLKAMEKVASHINEMQKIYEEYGTVFDQLVAEQSGSEKQITEISMGEFLMHSSAVWLNPFPSLGRMRKDPKLTVFVFKKAVILVCRESSKVKKKMGTARSAYSHGDLDPFKFRWLIPLSALQVRQGSAAASEANCVWELVHTKSELEGRPETTFQLWSSVQESKASAVKVIRSLLRENVRRTALVDRASGLRLGSASSARPPTSRTGSIQVSWMSKEPCPSTSVLANMLKGGQVDPDKGGLSSSTYNRGCDVGESLLASQELPPVSQQHFLSSDGGSQESGVQGENNSLGGAVHCDSLTSAIEAHLQRLWITEATPLSKAAPCVEPEGAELDTPVKQPNPLTRTAEIHDENHGPSLDDTPAVDLNSLLERDFSVQSLTSVLNEDCFFDKEEGKTPTATV
ncbi:T-lymphoma invasion and metastasis-inducing protein 2-like [Scleropages formosus]|uniref:TIAM Rac1 associated GEF 2 n=1 Tax=Scleropages formosus TaxID=113540 RepID=A0A8C9UXC4_SCLFO|nr:T-lymphoma invasion and metastasis-inducing protein 2-like [Scleropages formosus]XP_018599180.2 T-lymphoma invasion and metastasis-inducing protein 2-like [Scleropages formosus]XP_018599182.2 T-lymphoma invasion and metastasis-inducing protein 2-like [Scleropages formosus]